MSGGQTDILTVALCSARDELRQVLEVARRKFEELGSKFVEEGIAVLVGGIAIYAELFKRTNSEDSKTLELTIGRSPRAVQEAASDLWEVEDEWNSFLSEIDGKELEGKEFCPLVAEGDLILSNFSLQRVSLPAPAMPLPPTPAITLPPAPAMPLPPAPAITLPPAPDMPLPPAPAMPLPPAPAMPLPPAPAMPLPPAPAITLPPAPAMPLPPAPDMPLPPAHAMPLPPAPAITLPPAPAVPLPPAVSREVGASSTETLGNILKASRQATLFVVNRHFA